MWARGKPGRMTRHAEAAADAERPRITIQTIERVLEEPDHDTGTTATKRLRGRTIIVHYAEDGDAVYVITVSATRARRRA